MEGRGNSSLCCSVLCMHCCSHSLAQSNLEPSATKKKKKILLSKKFSRKNILNLVYLLDLADVLNENVLVTSCPIITQNEDAVLQPEILAQFLFMQKEILNECIARVKLRKIQEKRYISY